MLGLPDPNSGWRQIPTGIGRLAAGIPQGLGHLAVGAGQIAIAPIRIPIDLARGDAPDSAGGYIDKYAPLARDIGESFATTAQNIRDPRRYAQAWREGRIAETVFEDAGNVLIVTAPATKIATAAAPGSRLAAGAAKVSRIGNKIADAPITIPLRAASKVARGAVRLAEAQPGLQRRLPGYLTDEGRLARAEARQATSLGAKRAHRLTRDLKRVSDEIGDETLEGVALATRNRVADVDVLGLRLAEQSGLDITDPIVLEAARREVATRDFPEQTYTPELAAAARDYVQGRMDPEQMQAVERARQAAAEQIEPFTADALEGEGWVGQLDPQQLGDDALDFAVEQQLRDRGFSEADVDSLREWREQGDTWEDISQIVPEVAEILLDPIVYPAPWRPALMVASRYADAGLTGMPRTPRGLLAEGIPRPEYVPGQESRVLRPRVLTDEQVLTSEGLPGFRSQSAEHMRSRAEIQAYSFRTLAESLSGAARLAEANKALARFVEEAAVNRVGTVLPTERIAAIRKYAQDQARIARAGADEVARITDQLIVEALEAQGWEVFVGDPTNITHGSFDPTTRVEYGKAMVGDDAIVLPVGVKSVLEQRWKPSVVDPIVRGLEWSNTFVKRNTLPFSVRWHLGDFVGGMFMAWLEGGISPREFLRAQKRLSELSPELQALIADGVLDHPLLVQDGFAAQELAWMRRDSPNAVRQPRTPIGRGLNRFRERSYGLNNAINRFNRHHYVLAQLWRKLEANGIDLDNLDANPHLWDTPDVQQAITDAVSDANRTMGDFDNLTPFERRIMRGFYTYYTWMRHITALTYRVARDNPQRLVWTLRLGQYGTEKSEEYPPWARGSISVGNWLLPTAFLNPLYDVAGDSVFSDPFRPMNPGIKFVIAGATGVDMSNEFSQVTRPYGTGRVDELGRPVNTPLIQRPGELAYYGLNFLPLPRTAMNLAPTMEVAGVGLGPHARYRQGSAMVDRAGNPRFTQSRLRQASKLILPITGKDEAREIMRTAEERKNRLRQQQRQVRVGLGL